jgi:membrane-associated phospholipid phosphatase
LTAVAEDGIEATIFAAGVVTPLLKTVFGRTRPRHTDNSHTFGGSGHSFPSGETTQAFAIASVIAAHSESSWAKAAAWGGASLVGLGRIGLDGHWASDVVAGALIGAAVGTWVVRRNRPDLESKMKMTWIPTVGKDQYGLAMHVSF